MDSRGRNQSIKGRLSRKKGFHDCRFQSAFDKISEPEGYYDSVNIQQIRETLIGLKDTFETVEKAILERCLVGEITLCCSQALLTQSIQSDQDAESNRNPSPSYNVGFQSCIDKYVDLPSDFAG